MATAAFMALKPFTTFANTSVASLFGFGNNNRLVLLHTGNNSKYLSYAEEKIALLKNRNHNLLLVKYDSRELPGSSYEIVIKNNIKTGIIKVGATDNISSINDMAAFLKKEKSCQLVICYSDLGFKNKSGLDDLTVAEKSTYIDIIIGNHASNHTPNPVVARNSKRGEVIIHHASDNGFGLGNIEVEFDDRTNAKRSVAINNLLTRLPGTA